MLSMTPTAFVTGATGEIGSQLVSLLQSSNTPTRVLCRRQDQVDNFNQRPLVEAALGNLNQSVEAFASQMSGCKTLFLLTPPASNQLDMEVNSVDAAISCGTIEFIVKIAASDQRLRRTCRGRKPTFLPRSICGRLVTRRASSGRR